MCAARLQLLRHPACHNAVFAGCFAHLRRIWSACMVRGLALNFHASWHFKPLFFNASSAFYPVISGLSGIIICRCVFLWVFYSVWEARIVPGFTMASMERSWWAKFITFIYYVSEYGYIWCIVRHPAILLCIIYPFWGSGGGGCQQFRCWYVDNFLTFLPLNCQQLGLFGVVLHIAFSSFQKSYPHFCIAFNCCLICRRKT